MSQLIKSYLQTKSLNDLRAEHGVRVHVKGHLATLAYDQFEAKNSDEIACHCRGMVIAREDGADIDVTVPFEARVLAFPFIRFFNYGHMNLVFEPMAVYEKVDGTMIVCYFDSIKNVWRVATRNVPDGSNVFGDHGVTFHMLFERALQEQFGLTFKAFTDRLYSKVTYVFELMTPMNQVVVKHDKFHICFLGARELDSGVERLVRELDLYDRVPTPKNHIADLLNHRGDFAGLEDKSLFEALVIAANARDPQKHEGYVILGPGMQRLKIKSDAYVTFNKVHDLTKYDILGLILDNTIDDFIPMMQDHHKVMVDVVSEKLSLWVTTVNKALADFEWFKYGSRKDFAAYLIPQKVLEPLQAHIFRAYAKNATITEVQSVLVGMKGADGRYSDASIRKIADWISL